MDRGVFESSLVQQMMEGSPTWWWSMNNNMRPPPQPAFPLLPSSSSWSSSSSSAFPQHPQPSDIPMAMASCQDSQELPDSWRHLLLGGLVGEEEESGLTPFQTKKIENCKHQVYLSATAHMADIKQEYFGSGYVHGHGNEEIHDSKSTWNHVLPASNSNSCITTSFSSNMLDFSNKAHNQPDNSSECNSIETAPAFKKARIQGSSPPKSTLKVRKEKLGDRITALHQLVSSFGKTDTASVLLEAIGYIRFLQSQIEALSSPYVGNGSRNMKQPAQENMRLEDPGQFLNESGMKKPQDQQERNDEETKKDLRSRGLCLVPLSFITMHVGSDTGADSWAPITPGGDFQ